MSSSKDTPEAIVSMLVMISFLPLLTIVDTVDSLSRTIKQTRTMAITATVVTIGGVVVYLYNKWPKF